MKLHLPLLITALTSSINATLSEQYGAPVILHTDHCAKKLLPWVDGLLSASERYHAEHGEPLFSSHMIDLSEEPIEENIDICKSYLERFAKMGMLLEMELGITGGEEDGVNNEDVPLEDLYPKPEEIYMVYDELSKISDQFTVAAAFGNVHGVFSPGNVKLEPKILTRAQAYISDKLQDKAPVDKKPVKFVFHGGSGTTSDTNPNGFEVPVFSDGRRNSVSISLILLFGLCFIMIVVDHQNLVRVFSFSFQLL
jgi:fructose-bisphosphate aldolase class II